MTRKQLLREARLHVLGSYLHKALLVLFAGLGFGMLAWLGKQQDTERRFYETRWQVPPGQVNLVPEAVAAVSGVQPRKDDWPCAGVPTSAAPSFGSRELLILGMGNQAEACVWKRFGETVKTASQKLQKLAAAGRAPHADGKVADFADFIGKEEALARITARAARNYVVARLSSVPLSPKKASLTLSPGMASSAPSPKTASSTPSPGKASSTRSPGTPSSAQGGSQPPSNQPALERRSWRNSLDWLALEAQEASADDSELHVAYEMLWYASLLVGVVAASLLFMTLLTAVPIAGSEGPWTKRIREILARVPAPDNKMIAVPLLAAAIGGGTLVGAVAGTRPGGQGRSFHDPLTINNTAAKGSGPTDPAGAAVPSITQSIVRGDETNNNSSTTNSGWPPPLEWQPPLVDLGSANESLQAMSVSSRHLVQAAYAANLTMRGAFDSLARRIDDVDHDAAATKLEVAALRADVSRIGSDLREGLGAEGPLVQAVESLTATVSRHEVDLARASRAAGEIDERQELSLAQAAETDPRGFFARTFERRLYRPGPLVPGIMSALLKDVTRPQVVKAFDAALTRMRVQEAQPRAKFQARLGHEIEKEFDADETMRQEARRVLTLETPALLKLCRVLPY
ncbi:MAG TPA: hypothetical protein VOA80_09160 [Thermoanaerobaculia bacterium]|nr:hypothetical protein [Thermoanaerobaculia bacterium]